MIDFDEAKKLYIEMWDWISKNNKSKWEWPGWKSNGGEIEDFTPHCFACFVDGMIDEGACQNCFCDWGECDTCLDGDADNNEIGIYDKWNEARSKGNRTKARKYAEIIRDAVKSEEELVVLKKRYEIACANQDYK